LGNGEDFQETSFYVQKTAVFLYIKKVKPLYWTIRLNTCSPGLLTSQLYVIIVNNRRMGYLDFVFQPGAMPLVESDTSLVLRIVATVLFWSTAAI
jgi:hypothetical protein